MSTRIIPILKKIQNFFVSVERVVLCMIVLIMVVLSFLQVILRQFFSTGILWGDVFLRHLVLWAGFLGAAIATAQHKHFAIDVVKKLFKPRTKIIIEALTNGFTVVCLWILSDASLKFFKDELDFRSVLFSIGKLEVEGFWLNSIIPAGFIILLIHFFFCFIETLFLIGSPVSELEKLDRKDPQGLP